MQEFTVKWMTGNCSEKKKKMKRLGVCIGFILRFFVEKKLSGEIFIAGKVSDKYYLFKSIEGNSYSFIREITYQELWNLYVILKTWPEKGTTPDPYYYQLFTNRNKCINKYKYKRNLLKGDEPDFGSK